MIYFYKTIKRINNLQDNQFGEGSSVCELRDMKEFQERGPKFKS